MRVTVVGVDSVEAEETLVNAGFFVAKISNLTVEASSGACVVETFPTILVKPEVGVEPPIRVYIGEPGERCVRIESGGCFLVRIEEILKLLKIPGDPFVETYYKLL